eukprot:TRINITY_DN453_c0_g1_i2.p1 TRINITY_DN453_c0_g1~~TRINITY_DN453_c0_g1_i2.p1  ORF type:complete len:177 (+),score=43.15 TRINITY_DN453_c0_g1_i2:32-532(+)
MAEEKKLAYSFTQTLRDVSVLFKLEKPCKSRDLEIKWTKTTLSVRYKNSPQYLCNGELHKPIKIDPTTWTLDGTDLTVELAKSNGNEWWSCVLKGDPEIDTSKIVPENSKLSDLDSESRGLVEKMMFDQEQKAQGKPTSDELKQKEMLAKFMKEHPEMDFSNAKIN